MATPPLVLVADDHKDSRAILRDVLELRGNRVLEAEDGVVCLRIAREQHPDLIVLDLFMPRMDGWQVAQVLGSAPDTASIPILAFTASAMADDHKRALAAGCRRVLVKPMEPTCVADAVAALHAEHLVLLEQRAALRQEYLAEREQVVQSLTEHAQIRATTTATLQQSDGRQARSAAASTDAATVLGGRDAPAGGPAAEGPAPGSGA